MVKLANLVTEIYANGAELLVEGSRLGIKGNPPQRIYNEVEEHKKELLEALRGDPLSGPGREIREALFREALRWIDRQAPAEVRKVTKALCHPSTVEHLNNVWIDGTFDEFRAALK